MSVRDMDAVVDHIMAQVERINRVRVVDPEAARQLEALGWLLVCVGALDEAVADRRWDGVQERMAMLRRAAEEARWRAG